TRSQADAVESRIEMLVAQLDDIADQRRVVTQLIDVMGPWALASTEILAAWKATDYESRDLNESVEVAQERFVNDARDVCRTRWRLLCTEAQVIQPPNPSEVFALGPAGGALAL